MPILINCPSCSRKLRVPDDLLGQKVKCPTCTTTFTAAESEPPAAEPPPPPPKPAAQPAPEEGFEEEAPRPARRPTAPRADDEYEDDLDDRPRRRSRAADDEYEDDRPRRRSRDDDDEAYASSDRLAGLSSDYSIDFGTWFEYAKAHYSAVLGPMIGYTFISFLISLVISVIPFAGGLIGFLINPALQAGFMVVAVAQLKGERWSFGDFFGGFRFYGPILVSTFLVVVVSLVCFAPMIAVVFMAVASRSGAMVAVAVIVGVVDLLASMFIIVRLSFFSVPLIVDRALGPIEAIQGSWTLSRGHSLGLVGVSILLGLINLAGAMLCLVGVLFSAPLVYLTTAAGYLLVAGTRPPLRQPRGSRRSEEYDD